MLFLLTSEVWSLEHSVQTEMVEDTLFLLLLLLFFYCYKRENEMPFPCAWHNSSCCSSVEPLPPLLESHVGKPLLAFESSWPVWRREADET